jgi:hypothetical protein
MCSPISITLRELRAKEKIGGGIGTRGNTGGREDTGKAKEEGVESGGIVKHAEDGFGVGA